MECQQLVKASMVLGNGITVAGMIAVSFLLGSIWAVGRESKVLRRRFKQNKKVLHHPCKHLSIQLRDRGRV